MFEFNSADPADFIIAASEAGQPQKVLKHGQHLSFP